MRAVYLDVSNNAKPAIIDLKDDLNEFYKLIKCDCIDIVSRKIGNKYYDIICDDNGLLVNRPVVSAIDILNNPALVGNLLIVGEPTACGEMTELSTEEAKMICDNTCLCQRLTEKGLQFYWVLRLNHCF